MVGVDKSDKFMYLHERGIASLNGWKEKMLSMGARKILLKVVINLSQFFSMAVFKILNNMCKRIIDARAEIW
jgi:hypothetical protein